MKLKTEEGTQARGLKNKLLKKYSDQLVQLDKIALQYGKSM